MEIYGRRIFTRDRSRIRKAAQVDQAFPVTEARDRMADGAIRAPTHVFYFWKHDAGPAAPAR